MQKQSKNWPGVQYPLKVYFCSILVKIVFLYRPFPKKKTKTKTKKHVFNHFYFQNVVKMSITCLQQINHHFYHQQIIRCLTYLILIACIQYKHSLDTGSWQSSLIWMLKTFSTLSVLVSDALILILILRRGLSRFDLKRPKLKIELFPVQKYWRSTHGTLFKGKSQRTYRKFWLLTKHSNLLCLWNR